MLVFIHVSRNVTSACHILLRRAGLVLRLSAIVNCVRSISTITLHLQTRSLWHYDIAFLLYSTFIAEYATLLMQRLCASDVTHEKCELSRSSWRQQRIHCCDERLRIVRAGASEGREPLLEPEPEPEGGTPCRILSISALVCTGDDILTTWKDKP